MHPDLEDLNGQLEAVKAEGRAVVAGLSDAELNWRPGPERWSIGDCLAHLNVTVRATLPAFDKAIAAGRAAGRTATGPFRYGWLARQIVRSMEPPVRRRFRSPRVFRIAPTTYVLAILLPDFLAVRDELAARVRRADGLDLKRVKVTSPASRFFRMPLGAYFAFVLAHERRHLWQARAVRAALPTAGR